nr:glycosyl hydrolase family 18 protein [Desulfitobacterium hafniense]
KPSVKAQLESKGLSVTRYAGADRYLTNVDVLSKLNLDTSSVYVATGNDFPDALAGAVLAAKRNNPILLVPSTDLNSQTTNYLSARRTGGSSFTLLGGWGVISYKLENIIRTGSIKPRISLQYLQAYGSSAYTTYLSQINMAPGKATDYVDFVAPNWYAINNIPSGKTVADGTFTGPWDTASNNYTQIVNAAHGRGLKVLPVIGSSWDSEGKAAVDSIMKEPTARTSLVNNLVRMLAATGADGVVIDLEYMSDETGPYLTEFMKELYAALHPKNKIVIQAVMSRTSSTDWYPEFNYKELSQHVDYLNIMTYDYSMSVPGPIAPISWAKKVLEYTKSQGVDMSKVLMGVPYYGRDWAQKDATSYTKKSVGLMSATNAATEYKATIQRETSPEDSVGIPNYSYTDADKIVHKVYFDDPLSWERKLMLMQEYNLGGIGAWSMMWVTDEIGKELFPVLNRNLR